MALIRAALTFFHCCIIVLMLGTLLNDYVAPKTLGYLNLLSLSFPILLIFHVALTLFWILVWKKRAIVFILLSLFFLKPAQRIVNYNPTTVSQEGQIRIITFNTKNGIEAKDGAQTSVKDYLESENADIVIVQEDRTKLESENVITEGGTQLFSKYKIVNQETLITDGSNSHSFYADLDIDGKIVRIVNVYLQPFQLQKSMVKPTGDATVDQAKAKKLIFRLVPTFKAHQSQVEQIRRAIDDSPYPVIIGGDFNSVPNSWEYYHLVEGLQDPFLEVGHGSATSFHDYKFPIRIDYLFHSSSIKAKTYKVDRSVHISDHFPVIATFDLK